MRIEWEIKKKRGNWRPVLKYKCVFEDWENELEVQTGKTEITVPSAYDERKKACYPGEYERDEREQYVERKRLWLSSKENVVVLPWRPGKSPEYADVEEAMRKLMEEWERRVMEALESGSLNIQCTVEHSTEFKKKIAPLVAVRRMLE